MLRLWTLSTCGFGQSEQLAMMFEVVNKGRQEDLPALLLNSTASSFELFAIDACCNKSSSLLLERDHRVSLFVENPFLGNSPLCVDAAMRRKLHRLTRVLDGRRELGSKT